MQLNFLLMVNFTRNQWNVVFWALIFLFHGSEISRFIANYCCVSGFIIYFMQIPNQLPRQLFYKSNTMVKWIHRLLGLFSIKRLHEHTLYDQILNNLKTVKLLVRVDILSKILNETTHYASFENLFHMKFFTNSRVSRSIST